MVDEIRPEEVLEFCYRFNKLAPNHSHINTVLVTMIKLYSLDHLKFEIYNFVLEIKFPVSKP